VRINFDLHRASGLWLWPELFIFAWSSVSLTIPGRAVYDNITSSLFPNHSRWDEAEQVEAKLPSRAKHPNEKPKLSWRQAQARGEHLLAERAAKTGLGIKQHVVLGYFPDDGVFTYVVRSTLDVEASVSDWQGAGVWIDGDTGEPRLFFQPAGQDTGNTVTAWLRALHFADVHDNLAFRVFLGFFGVGLVTLSVTGVYIWRRKRPSK